MRKQAILPLVLVFTFFFSSSISFASSHAEPGVYSPVVPASPPPTDDVEPAPPPPRNVGGKRLIPGPGSGLARVIAAPQTGLPRPHVTPPFDGSPSGKATGDEAPATPRGDWGWGPTVNVPANPVGFSVARPDRTMYRPGFRHDPLEDLLFLGLVALPVAGYATAAAGAGGLVASIVAWLEASIPQVAPAAAALLVVVAGGTPKEEKSALATLEKHGIHDISVTDARMGRDGLPDWAQISANGKSYTFLRNGDRVVVRTGNKVVQCDSRQCR